MVVRLGLAALAVVLLARCGGSTPLVTEEEANTSIVAVIGGHVLSQDEFRQEYDRNNSFAASDSNAYEDFLEQYVDFRLKVLAAEASGYGEDPAMLNEIHTYRAAFARPYLVDREVLAPILMDYYEKKKEIVRASHIFTRLLPEMTAADSLLAYARTAALRDSVLQGMNFGDVALLYSEDPSAANPASPQGYRGDLGWFTAGMMIKSFEDRAYTEPIGEVSEVFQSDYGYHVLKVHDRRPMVPNVRLSQILVRINGTAPESTAVARERIEAAKARLDAGQNFAYVASELSEEVNSRGRGGDVGFLSYLSRGIDSTFKEIAFNIDAVGDVTDIVQTGYGFQILKLTGRDTLGTYKQEFEDLRREAQNLPRMIRAESALAEDARNRYAVSLDTAALVSLVAGVRRDSVRAHISAIAPGDSLGSVVIGRVGDSLYTASRLARFAGDRNNRARNGNTTVEQVVHLGNAFLDFAAITHTAMALEDEDEEFAWIMQNFRDGLLLYKLMEDSVWAAASADTSALVAHYEARKERYMFPERHRIMEVFAYYDSVHEAAILELEAGMTWPEFYDYVRKDSVALIRFDTVLVEGPSRSVYDRALGLEPGERSEIIPYRNGFLALYYDGVEPPRQKTFEEAKGEVIAELQAVLEENLLARLRARYNVKTFPERAREAILYP